MGSMGSRHEVEKKSGVDAGDRNGRCVVCISLFTLWMLEVLQLPELVRLANGSPREKARERHMDAGQE
jgi:hypothetical protein